MFMEWTKRAVVNKLSLAHAQDSDASCPCIKDIYIETNKQYGRLAKFLAHNILYNTGMAEDWDEVLVILKYRPHQNPDIQVEVYVDQQYDQLMVDHVFRQYRNQLDQLLQQIKDNNIFYHVQVQQCTTREGKGHD